MMQPQAGIAALPTAPQQAPQMAPGQAPGIQQVLPQMQPQAGGSMSAPQSFVSPLKGRDLQQLLQEFNNPQSQYPKYAVLAAMKERQEADRMRAAVQGQGAMQQAQQQGSVANDVVAQAQASQPPPVMAAQGGIMHGYASGGPVAFAPGGGVSQEFGDSPEAYAMDELRIREAQLAKKRAEDKAKYEFLKNTAPEVAARMAAENPELALPVATPAPVRTIAPPSPPAPLRQDPPRRNPALGTPALGTPAAASGLSTLVPPPAQDEVQRLIAKQVEEARARTAAGESPELAAANKGIAALAAEDIAIRQAESKALQDERLAAKAAAQARSGRGPTAQELFALAGGIDTRKGQGMGSLARTASGLLGTRETAAEAARKEDILAQREQRGMQATIRQVQMLEAQRQQLLAKGKVDEAAKLQEQIDALLRGAAEYGVKRGDVAFKQDIELRGAKTEERKAAAAMEAARNRGEPRPVVPKTLTYDQAADNVGKFMESIPGMQEIMSIQKKAKDAGQPIPSTAEIRNMLIAQELRAGGGADPTSNPQATLPASALSQLKEGLVTRFANGQQWTIENGQPKQVK